MAVTAEWALAATGGASFGPSTVGAVSSMTGGAPKVWLLTFLVGIIGGGVVAARSGPAERRGDPAAQAG